MRFMAFCSFSKARTSIWRMRSLLSVILGVDPTDVLEDEDVEEVVKSVAEAAGGD